MGVERGQVTLVTGSTSGIGRGRNPRAYGVGHPRREGGRDRRRRGGGGLPGGEEAGYVRGVVLNVDGGLAIA